MFLSGSHFEPSNPIRFESNFKPEYMIKFIGERQSINGVEYKNGDVTTDASLLYKFPRLFEQSEEAEIEQPKQPIVYTATCGYKIKRNDIKCFKGDGIFTNSVMEAKRYKILPHLFFDNEITIWIDGNIFLKTDDVLDRFLGDADIAIFKHPYRSNIWQEFDVLQEDERFKIPWLQKQLKAQRKEYEKNPPTGLWECNFIIRRNNERVNRLNEMWWAEICRWQWRDQVSFPYVLSKSDVKIKTIEEGNIRNHKLFKYVNHY